MADQRKAPQNIIATSKKSTARYCFHLCYITVMDNSLLECYLHVKHNETNML